MVESFKIYWFLKVFGRVATLQKPMVFQRFCVTRPADLEFYSLNNILDRELGAVRPLLTVIELECFCIFHGIPRSVPADCYSPRPTGGVLVKSP